jgi:hypothetical protein
MRRKQGGSKLLPGLAVKVGIDEYLAASSGSEMELICDSVVY